MPIAVDSAHLTELPGRPPWVLVAVGRAPPEKGFTCCSSQAHRRDGADVTLDIVGDGPTVASKPAAHSSA
jgi:hypothetical protein